MKFKFLVNVLFLILLNNLYAAGQNFNLLIEEADKYTRDFEHEKSLLVCQEADEQFPANWEIKWRLSRAYINVGMNMPASTDEQVEEQFNYYEKGFEAADQAVKLAPEKSVCYLRRAIANGRIAMFKGVFTVGDIVEQVKLDCEKSIELGNGGDDIQGITNYVLARTHAKISEKWAPARSVLGLGWANIDSALFFYEKAVELKPNYTMIFVDYAIALMREDKYDKAKEMLSLALEAPNSDVNDFKRKEEAKELLAEIEEELE